MKKVNSGPSLYHVSDKAISDGLEKVSKIQMIHFLRRKGIFVSESIEKDELIKYIRTFNFSYSDYLWITKQLENPNKRIRTEVAKIDLEIETDELKQIANKVKSSLSSEDINCRVIKNDNTIKLELNYLEEDLSVSELKQKQPIKTEIELTNNNGSIGIRYGSLQDVKKVKDILIDKIKEETNNADLEPIEISLQFLTSPEVRSEFFMELSKAIEGYKFDDILSVDVTKDFNFNIDDDDDDDDDEKDDIKERHIAAIRSAALKGVSVTSTPHFTQLHNDGYYIYKIVWSSIHDILEGKKVIFEAQFGNKVKCNNFKYLVKYIYDVAKRKNAIGLHTKRHREISDLERKNLNSKLEKAALDTYASIVEKYGV